MSMNKSVFYWGSIAGARYEPVEVTKEDGKRVGRTIGCPDTFDLSVLPKKSRLCILGEKMDRPEGPFTPEEIERNEKNELRCMKYAAKQLRDHAWRGPR